MVASVARGAALGVVLSVVLGGVALALLAPGGADAGQDGARLWASCCHRSSGCAGHGASCAGLSMALFASCPGAPGGVVSVVCMAPL